MLFLSQLNRAVVQDGEVQRPTMSNLRESGEIEQHADMIWFVFRAAYALERKSGNELGPGEREQLATMRQQLELIVAKFRNGETGTVELFVDMPRNAIRDRMSMGAAT